MQPMSTPILEELVLSKPYFDRHGLIVAEQDGRQVAFVHAGFGPNADRSDISTETGVISMMQLSPEVDGPSLRHDLLGEAEEYLRGRGAVTILGGEFPPVIPFYLGLYGGSELPGILQSDKLFSAVFQQDGYEEASSCVLMNCKLGPLRLPFDRQQRQLAREFDVEAQPDHYFDTWWDACTLGQTQHTFLQLVARGDRSTFGSAIVWDLEPLSSSWGVHVVGISQLRISDSRRREGLATLLISQTMKKLQSTGVSLVQVQILSANEAALNLYHKLGFEDIDRGVCFRKTTV